MKTQIRFLSLALLALWVGLGACRKTELTPGESFTVIFDNNEFGGSFLPVDVKQTTDGGYVILGEHRLDDSNFYGVYVLRTDALGRFLWDYKGEVNQVNPVSELFVVNNEFYFMAMDGISLNAQVMKVDSAGASIVNQVAGVIYPLAMAQINDGFLLVSYDRLTRSSALTRLNNNFQAAWTQRYDVFEDAEERVIGHLTKTRRQFPFFAGAVGNSFYVNTFSNFTLSTLFVSPTDGSQQGVLNGFRYDDAISAAVPLNNNTFVMTRYSFGENFLLPQQAVNLTGVTSTKDLGGNRLVELTPDAKVVAKRLTINSRQVIVLASDTKNSQIVLYAYDAATGQLLGKRFLGFGSPYRVSGYTLTADGGMAVVGTNIVTGRFPRICLFKLSPSDVNGLISGAE
ncbi:hypothetical protein [Eisenibacter elegans]|jgi:hypothetical protein|uniref:hypothetical protein n=1 Tax=Eisenibacter elegans TaxID=997 RepID=UPI00041C6495|nr:hypothetical protein [Eisenibacter elegans]